MKTCNLFFLMSALLFFLTFAGCASIQKHQVHSADNVPISYDVWGAGKPALVFVHGWCCDKRYWSFQVPYFAREYQVVTIDLAGHGASGLGRTDWTIEAFGRDVVAVVEKLDLNQVILIGHSMGGYVIIEAARQMPERVIGLVGVDTLHDFETEFTQEQIEKFVSAFKEDFVRNTVAFVRGMFKPGSDPDMVRDIALDVSSTPPQVGIGALQGYFNYDVIDALKDVHVPVYCINTDLLPTNVEANRRHVVSFEVKLMPGMSHFIMIEDPKTFNRLLDETIDELIRKENILSEKKTDVVEQPGDLKSGNNQEMISE
jgi:pimeloyl-ACP methyl ester carboxylesterase